MAGAACYMSGRPGSLINLKILDKKNASFNHHKVLCLGSKSSADKLFFLRTSFSYGSISSRRRRKPTRPSKSFVSPVMQWQDCSSEIEVDVPCSVAYQIYSERESIPEWMPFISSVKVLPDKPDLSRWSLKYEFLGRDVEFSWLARNMQPIPNQKIHWRSLEGLPNKGAVRFFPKGPSSCRIQLTVSYEVPEILTPVASALKPFLEGLLSNGLGRFATFARDRQRKIPRQ